MQLYHNSPSLTYSICHINLYMWKGYQVRYVDGLHGRIPLTFARVSALRVAFDYKCIFMLILYNKHVYNINLQIILRGLMAIVVHFDER